MESSQDPNLKPFVPADGYEFDLYSIPSHSSWFAWDNIHDIERFSLKEFFDGISMSRTPKIYKDYRDFIISKYREDPSRRLTFTEVRKSLVGDVSFLHKVFSFLEKWGLINFSAPPAPLSEEDKEETWRVKVEEGAPHGVRVVAVPNSLKPVLALPPVTATVADGGGDAMEDGLKFPPLASHSDVYGELLRQKGLVCENCKGRGDSGYYEYTKGESFIICSDCFKSGNFGENKSLENLKFMECCLNSGNGGAVWTEAETLLLLESVLKHGDDWDLVAQNVQTKSKIDCISKLIQLPFGDLMFGSANRKGRYWESNGDASSVNQMQLVSSKSQETVKEENQLGELKNENQQNGNAENQEPPPKRRRMSSIPDAIHSLMKQAAHISTVVGPHITASAAEAAVTALCYENLCPREIFDGDDYGGDESRSSPHNNEKNRTSHVEDSEMEERPANSETQDTSEDVIPLTLRMKAATATALGTAAAHAKLLADQEDREIEHLVATLIEMQLKKVHCKIKHFDDLELIMEKEHTLMEELEESLIVERMNVLQRIFKSGISRTGDLISVKSQMSGVL